MKKILSLALCAALLLTLAACGGSKSKPEPSQEAVRFHHVEIDIADYGVIKLELDREAAPISVDNFLKLAGDGFYDGLTFHRIIKGFMMQGGAAQNIDDIPESIYGEFQDNGWDNPIPHTRGVISMARADDYDSATSQFFIVHADSPHLDGHYAAFGRVTEGMEVVDAVCETAQPVDNNGSILPEERPVITSITVID